MAVSVTKEQVLALAPELSTLTDGQWSQVIADVQAEVPETAFSTPERAAAAAIWLGAHMGTVLKRGGSATSGQVTSVRVGPVSKTFGSSGGSGSNLEFLRSTSYGQEYLRRTAQNIRAFVV